MPRKYWRIITALLVICMIIPAIAACQPNEDTTEVAAVEEPAEVEEVTEPEEAEEATEPEETEEVAEPEPEPEVEEPEMEPEPEGPVIMRVGTTSIWDGNNLGVEVTGWLPYRLIFDSIVEFGPNGAF